MGKTCTKEVGSHRRVYRYDNDSLRRGITTSSGVPGRKKNVLYNTTNPATSSLQNHVDGKRYDDIVKDDDKNKKRFFTFKLYGNKDSPSHNTANNDSRNEEDKGSHLPQPPHSVLRSQVEELSSTFTFYVHISGIKCRNLKYDEGQQAMDVGVSSILDSPPPGIFHTTDTSSMTPLDAIKDVSDIDRSFVNDVIGTEGSINANNNTSWPSNRYTLVNNPGCFVTIDWEDYSFYSKTSSVMASTSPKWHDSFQFQWKVSCISKLQNRYLSLSVYKNTCDKGQLIGTAKVDLFTIATGPIHHDLLLHRPCSSGGRKKDESARGKNERDSGVGRRNNDERGGLGKFLGRRSNSPVPIGQDNNATPPNYLSQDFTNICGRIVFDVRMAQICQLIINPIEVLVDLHETSKRNSNASTAGSNTLMFDSSDNVPYATQTTLPKSPNLDQGDEEEDTSVTGRWQLSISPTGVDNPSEYFSRWTSVCDRPHWNTVDRSQLNSHTISQSDPADMIGQSCAKSSETDAMCNTWHPEDEDCPSTYDRLAAICRKGCLVREMLYNDLPTIQLLTTIDQLRQNHLHFNLYLKRAYGNREEHPKFYGETWLPFFKIYDADVVDQMDKHFFDNHFKEKLWLDGKCIGSVEGLIVFQNNPMARQMYAGVHTEHGFMRISPPILGSEHKSVKFNFPNQNLVPTECRRLAELHKNLLEILFSRAQHRPEEAVVSMGMGIGGLVAWQQRGSLRNFETQTEPSVSGDEKVATALQTVCESLLELLKASDAETRRLWVYRSESALLTGQRILLNLANHILEYFEYVMWQYRGLYCAILQQILRRGELDTGICLPTAPTSLKDLDYSELFIVYRYLKCHSKKHGKLTSIISAHSAKKDQGQAPGTMRLVATSKHITEQANPATTNATDNPSKSSTQHTLLTHPSKTCTVISLIANKGKKTLGQGSFESRDKNKFPPGTLSKMRISACDEGDHPNKHQSHKQDSGQNSSELIAKTICSPPTSITSSSEDQSHTKATPPPDMDPANSSLANQFGPILQQNDAVRSRMSVLQELANSLSDTEIQKVFLFHKRMKLCRQYFLLLHRMLYYGLQKLSSGAISEGQRKYISIFLCIAYFRLPVFREELLSSVLNSEEKHAEIVEWRGTEYNLDYESLKRLETWQPDAELRLLFDWSAFHSTLKAYFGEENLMEGLRNVKERTEFSTCWRDHFSIRGTFFFSFLEQWSKHVSQTVQRKDSFRWHTLPGYPTLLKALLLEMKARPVTKYPDALLNCTGALLGNERLLSVLIKILFLKTSVYHSPSVFFSMNYVDYWTQVLTLRSRPLPPNFDFNFLKRGLDIELGSDLCLNVSKGLWFIYKNVPVFQGEQVRAIVLNLMIERYFIKLFLNWSWLVRRCYMWFVLYRVCEGARKVVSALSTIAGTSDGVKNRTSDESRFDEDSFFDEMLKAVIKLSVKDKIMLTGYVEICSFLEVLESGEIFPPTPVVQLLPTLVKHMRKDGAGYLASTDTEVESSGHRFSTGGERVTTIPKECKVYVTRANAEFQVELDAYKDWVVAGASKLPTMHIPAAPLDHNIDVPWDVSL